MLTNHDLEKEFILPDNPNINEEEKNINSVQIPKIKNEENTTKNPNWKLRRNIFYVFLYVVIFSNYDTGVIPAALNNIQIEMDLNYTEQGLLGSLPYFGISFASIFVSYLIGKFKIKYILGWALFINICFCCLFSLVRNITVMYISRFFMGFTQAFWIIYGPVWTNHFSPIERQTTWIGFLQGFSPLGLIFGYLTTAVIVNTWTVNYSWRLSILIQAGLEIPIFIFLYFIKNSDLDILEHNEINSEKKDEIPTTSLSKIKILLYNKIFMLSSFCVCIAFFVVIGIQFWGTSYMITTMNASPHNAMITYSFVTITSPILGLITSGYILDHLGGYKGNNKFVTLKMQLTFSIICVGLAVPLSMVYDLFWFGPLLWLQIFFGACNVPAGIGMVIDSVDQNLQAYASSFSQFIYNMCGYFLSPLFSAAIMDAFNNRTEGMKWGFRINQFISVIGVILVIILIIVVKSINTNNEVKIEKEKNNETDTEGCSIS